MVERQVFCSGQSQSRRNQPLDGRVAGQVHEHYRPRECTGAFKVGHEVMRFLVGDAHGAEDDGELAFAAKRARLPRNLQGDVVMRQA